LEILDSRDHRVIVVMLDYQGQLGHKVQWVLLDLREIREPDSRVQLGLQE
jgi:hypothetical protein